MANERKLIRIDNTNFKYMTNFSGNPERDNFGSTTRKCNLLLDYDQAMQLRAEGFNVKETKNNHDIDGFEPEYFVPVVMNYDSDFPPKICVVSGRVVRPMDAETVGEIDNIRVKNVNAILNPYYNSRTGRRSLYVRTMYVEQDLSDDPYAARYAAYEDEDDMY